MEFFFNGTQDLMLLFALTQKTHTLALVTTLNSKTIQIFITTPLTMTSQVFSITISMRITLVATITHKPSQLDARHVEIIHLCQTVPELTSHATDQEMTGSCQVMLPNTQSSLTNTMKP